jgi:hypothetical protein
MPTVRLKHGLMNEPRICPQPGPRGTGPSCPLWDSRERIALQRSIEADGAARLGVGALVWAEMNRSYRRPDPWPTRPVPVETRSIGALVADETAAGVAEQKGSLSHV